jgi:N-acetylglutamate synthase-like GNAT family acetyltransferase
MINMTLESVTFKDLEEIKNLQPKGWSDIILDIEFYLKSTFCNPFKATIDNKIVGTGTLITYGNTCWIAHIIVGSDYRNNGIGSQIVNGLLEKIKKDTIETCSLIATDLGKPVYLKAGFRAVTAYTFFQREKPWVDCSVSKNVISFDEKYRTAIYKLDKKISGENREMLLKDFLESSRLYVKNGKVVGYYMPNLKEGLIFADTNEAGLELMKLKYSKTDKAALPVNNIEGLEFLKQNGFVETTQWTRMVFGKDLNWNPQKMYSRMGGNFG